MKKFEGNLVDRCCEVYGMSLSMFAKRYDLAESTLKQWRDPSKLPAYGKLLLETMIEVHELRKKADKFNQLTRVLSEPPT